MKDCVEGILPALMNEALRVRGAVFYKPVAIAVCVTINPISCPEKMFFYAAEKIQITSLLKIGPCDGEVEQGRIDAAIVQPKRYLPEDSHFAESFLVQHLAGFRVLGITHLFCLIMR